MEKQMIKHQTIPETVNDRIQLIGQEAETKIKREREREMAWKSATESV